MGLGVDEFYNLTFDELAVISDGYNSKKENIIKLSWEQSRFIAYHSVIPHTGKKKLKVTDLIEFEWEKKDKEEDIKKLKTVDFDKLFPKHMKDGKK